MSSDALQSVAANLRLNDYASLAIITAVGYDYVLTIPDEVEYIWTRPWTRVSALYFLIRYVGLCVVAINSLVGSTFTTSITPLLFQGKLLFIIPGWLFLLFISTADIMMILRVWAMYEQSRLVLGVLLASFSLETIPGIVLAGIFSNMKTAEETSIQILGWSICVWKGTFPPLMVAVNILQMVHGAIMCILAIARFLKQLLEMHSMMKQWQVGRYMNLLIKQGILYLVAIYIFNVIQVLDALGKFPAGGLQAVLLFILEYVPAFTLAPRFVLSIRRMYMLDAEGESGSGIDTGFGLSYSRDASRNTIIFAGIEQDEESEGIEETLRDGVPA